jgi:Glycine zipper 2TM domain
MKTLNYLLLALVCLACTASLPAQIFCPVFTQSGPEHSPSPAAQIAPVLVGGLAGGIIGHQAHHTLQGAAIGAALGYLLTPRPQLEYSSPYPCTPYDCGPRPVYIAPVYGPADYGYFYASRGSWPAYSGHRHDRDRRASWTH